jgi:ferritin-like metal-binding protein YciE
VQLENLQDLMKEDLKDVLHAENQIVKALPKMIKAATNPQLQDALEKHLEETREQVTRVEQVMELMGMPIKGKTCKAMQGILEEGKEVMEEDAEDEVMDAALIGAAQKVEHYEIATYGTLCTYADLLGLEEASKLLGQTLAEEKKADETLSELAEAVINLQAADRTEQ